MNRNVSNTDNSGNKSSLSAASQLPDFVSAQLVFVVAFLAIVILISVVGNVIVLCVTCRQQRVRSVSNALVSVLSVCDLLLTFTWVFACFVALASRARRHGDNHSACTLVATLNGVFGGMSACIVCMIAADRYYAVVAFPRRRFTMATMCNAIAAVTVLVCVVYFPWHGVEDCLLLSNIANTDHRLALVVRVVFYVTVCAIEINFCANFFKVGLHVVRIVLGLHSVILCHFDLANDYVFWETLGLIVSAC